MFHTVIAADVAIWPGGKQLTLSTAGRNDEAVSHFDKAVAMSPNHPQLWAFLSYGALNFIFNSDFERALEWAKRARDIPNCQYWATAHATVALAYLDRPVEARNMVTPLLSEQPDFSLGFAEYKLFYLRLPSQLRPDRTSRLLMAQIV